LTLRITHLEALLRKSGRTKCATFDNKAQAKAWAATVERELDQLRPTSVMAPKGVTLGNLVDWYIQELYPVKPWGRSKSAELARLKDDLGDKPVLTLCMNRIPATAFAGGLGRRPGAPGHHLETQEWRTASPQFNGHATSR
jgi:hypothetical protein